MLPEFWNYIIHHKNLYLDMGTDLVVFLANAMNKITKRLGHRENNGAAMRKVVVRAGSETLRQPGENGRMGTVGSVQ